MIGLDDVLSGLGDLGSIGSDVGSGLMEGAGAAGEGTDWGSLFGNIGDVASDLLPRISVASPRARSHWSMPGSGWPAPWPV